MQARRTITIAASIAAIAFTTSAQQAQNEPQNALMKYAKELGLQTVYSADMDMQVMGMAMAAKVWHDGDKSRAETTVPILNVKTVAIQTTKDGKPASYTLFPATKKYVVQPQQTAAAEAAADVVITDLGKEAYNGEQCVKKRMVVKGDESTTMDILFSPSKKNMPVKMTSAMGSADPAENAVAVILFKNYNFAKPDAALFTIPAGYTEAANMQEAMGGGLSLLMGMGATEGVEAGDANAEANAAAMKELQDALDNLSKTAQDATEQAARQTTTEAIKENAKDAATDQAIKGIRNLLR